MIAYDCQNYDINRLCRYDRRDLDREERRARMAKAINLTLVELVKAGKVDLT